MKKKKLEYSILAIVGIGLIVTSVILMTRKTKSNNDNDDDDYFDAFTPYDPKDRGMHVFSESGILL